MKTIGGNLESPEGFDALVFYSVIRFMHAIVNRKLTKRFSLTLPGLEA